LKSKCENAKPTAFCPLDLELDLTLELCNLTLFKDLASEIATPRLVEARNDEWYVIARSRATKQSGGEDGVELAGGFVLGAEAPRADVDFSFPSLYHNRSPLDIRQPASGGMLFGMAYTTPKVSFFTTNLALHRSFFYVNLRYDSTIFGPGKGGDEN
jgi:hypothetical protein